MTANPFIFGKPIHEPGRFYGRQQEVQQIANRLLSSAHESTSVVGERRLGKTSLLNYLSHREVAAGMGLTPDRYCLIYVDFQGLTDITPLRFWKRVLSRLARSMQDPELAEACRALTQREQFDLFDLEDLFALAAERVLTVVLLLDEFEYVTQNPNFGSDFFGGLRALAIHHNLALVPATRRELVDLCHSEEIKGSPFFNIFANVVLRPFSRQEAEQLLEGYVGHTDLAFTPEEKEQVLRLGGGHPFFVQMAGYYTAEGKIEGLIDAALDTFVTTCFNQQAAPHFAYLWTHSSESEKITLLAILALSRQERSKKTIPNLENLSRLHPRASLDVVSLAKRGLVLGSGGLYALFSPSLARWIVQEVTAGPGREESPKSVEEWLRVGGREHLEPLKGALPRFKKKYWPLMASILKEVSFEVAGAAAFELLTKSFL